MATLKAVMAELENKGSEKTRAIYVKHGAPVGRALGVSTADLKAIARGLKGQQALACELYATGKQEAMYLAGMVADGAKLSKKELQEWAAQADIPMISEYTVPWMAVENAAGRELALAWMKSKKEHVAAAGWSSYSGLLATKPDESLDLAEIRALMKTVVSNVHRSQNRVKAAMNLFVISVGMYVEPLQKEAKAVAKAIGPVSVDVGETACEVRAAADYLAKVEASGRAIKKRKTIRC